MPTELNAGRRNPALGIGRILKGSLLIVAADIGHMGLLGFVPLMALALLQRGLAIGEFAPESETIALFETGSGAGRSILAWIFTNTWAVAVYGFLVKRIHNLATGAAAGVSNSVVPVLMTIVPLAICDFLATLAILLGLAILVIPGLYLMGLWCVLVPSIIVEGSGFQSFRRSTFLTRDYRWVCVAIVTLMFVLNLTVTLGIAGLWEHLLLSNDMTAFFFLALQVLLSTLIFALSAAIFTLLFLRLRDIKEGNLPEVFT